MIRYIYTFFLGLFVAIFVGIGIAVFYTAPPSPEPPIWYGSVGKEGPTQAQQLEDQQYNIKQKDYQAKLHRYNRNVSAILLASSVIILVISLALSRQLGMLADGLLLGGIFTLLYGIGRGMDTDNNKYRFLVASVGLIITLVLGYVKFARHAITKEEAHSVLPAH